MTASLRYPVARRSLLLEPGFRQALLRKPNAVSFRMRRPVEFWAARQSRGRPRATLFPETSLDLRREFETLDTRAIRRI
jgi:hypothetical protein